MSQGIGSEPSAADKVFGIDELREEILKHVIIDKKGKISGKTVGIVRLVQKSWLQTTSKLLQKVKEPVIVLILDGNDSLEDANDVKVNGILKTFGASPRLQESFLPIKLNFKVKFFRERNYHSLLDCLTHLGNDLVELQLEYPKSGGTMPAIFPSFTLPFLRKLTFTFSDEEIKQDSEDDGNGLDDNRNGLVLLQFILNAGENLRDLVIPLVRHSKDVVPMDFKYIRLPDKISSLDMSIKLENNELEALLWNQLPNLSHLKLQIHGIPVEDELLFKILERFQKTLLTLRIKGLRSIGQPRPPKLLRFPHMEQLMGIGIYSTECELGPGNLKELQKCFPELIVVSLKYQTEARLAKWTGKSIFENVQDLSVSVVNEQLDGEHDRYFISPDTGQMTRLHQSFPNILRMSLTVNISDLTSLKSLFRDMIQLMTLKISFVGDEAALDSSSDLIDSVLLGLPLRLVVTLKENIQLLDAGTITIKAGSEPSIRNLSELVCLSLSTKMVGPGAALQNGMSLISNLLFGHALVKMATLRKLHLYKKFKPSLTMKKEWSRQGRCIKYNNI